MTQHEHAATGCGLSQCDAILCYLTGCIGQWVQMPDLARIAGSYAVHSQIGRAHV